MVVFVQALMFVFAWTKIIGPQESSWLKSLVIMKYFDDQWQEKFETKRDNWFWFMICVSIYFDFSQLRMFFGVDIEHEKRSIQGTLFLMIW